MSKDFLLFEKDEITFNSKFMLLQDLLIENKSTSRTECFIFFSIFYLQTICGFFSANVGVLDIKNSSSDAFLNYIHKIFRVKDLFIDDFNAFQAVLLVFFIALILSTIYYIYVVQGITKNRLYSYKEQIINTIFKVFLFIAFNPILDLCMTNICFETLNPSFSTLSCNVSDYTGTFIIGLIMFFYASVLCFFINIFYNDSQFLQQNNYYSRMNCNYEFYITLNNIVYAILLSQVRYLGMELFLIYNVIISFVLMRFYYNHYLFYDNGINTLVGIFHFCYLWTSLYCFIFSFIEIREKGIILIMGLIIIGFLFYNLKDKLENFIIFKTPFNKISNKFYVLFYLKTLMQKIHNIQSNICDKAQIMGIIQAHILECPVPTCPTKHKDVRIYLPISDEWTNRENDEINDRVFLLNFIVVVMNYYILQNFTTTDMMINRSLYYLTVLGNNCKAMMYYNIAKESKLNIQQRFALMRVYFQISKALVNKLKPSHEGCVILDELNVTLFFKYEDLSQKFFDEMNNDISLSLEFWGILKQHHETNRVIDFNKIFMLTKKIRKVKAGIEKLWNDIFHTYSGVNDLFDLYENYIEQINDDDMLKRELETLRNKNSNSSEHIQVNYYNLLFNKDTGIIIANGDKGKEGIIEKANDEIEKIFEYKVDELKGMNVTKMIPRTIARKHHIFMERFYEIGEKRILDKQLRTYAKDKDNCIIPTQLYVKLFPILSDHVFYCGLVFRENLDDLIIIDKKFNIQCCSRKLMEKLEIQNKLIFLDYEIPFYILCKKFVNFFKVFLKKQKKKILDVSQINYNEILKDNEIEIENYEINDNVEIAENTELEYEIVSPQFLLEYASLIADNKRETTFDLTIDKKNTLEGTNIREDTSMLLMQNMDENDLSNDVNATANKLTIGDDINQKDNFGFDKQQNEEKEFLTRIAQYRNLFEYGRYAELEELVTKSTADMAHKEYRFNFTFVPYRFGEGEMLYIIRCIDNKSEFDNDGSTDDSHHGSHLNKNDAAVGKNFTAKYFKSKQAALTELVEVTNSERGHMLEKNQEYLKMCIEDKEFIKTQVFYKEEIGNISKIFGMKKEEHRNYSIKL